MNRSASLAERAAWAGYAFYALGALMVLILPLYIGLAAVRLGLSPAQLGLLAAIEASGGVVASMTGGLWIGRASWRLVSAAGLLVMIAGALATPLMEGFTQLMVLRLLTSIFGAGLVYTMGVAILSRTVLPDRHFAIGGGLQALVPAGVLLVGPMMAASFGLDGLMVLVAIVFAGALPLLPLVPSAPPGEDSSTLIARSAEAQPSHALAPWMFLLSALFLTAATNAYWAFAERVGEAAGLAQATIGGWLATSAVIGIPAAAVAALCAARGSRALWFIIGTAGFAAGLVSVLSAVTYATFACSVVLLFFCSVFLTPFQFGALAEADTSASGKYAVLAPAAQSLGVMAGPAVAGAAIRGGDFGTAVIVALAFLATSWLAFQLGLLGRAKVGAIGRVTTVDPV